MASCTRCNGTGTRMCMSCFGSGKKGKDDCRACSGMGASSCYSCGGSGKAR